MTILLFCRRGREFFAGVLEKFGRLCKTCPSGGSVPAKKRAPAGGTVTTSRAQNGDMQFLDGDGLPWGSGFYAWDRAFNVSPRAPCALRRNKNAACKSAAERCAGDCRRLPPRRRQGLPRFPALHPERSLRKAVRRVRPPATGGNFSQFPRRRAARDGAAQPPTGCRQFS